MRRFRTPSPQQGVVLLEALIAVLIFSLGILGVVGLQASMIRAAGESRYRAEAGFLVQQRLGQMWVDQGADQSNLVNYVEDEPGTDIASASGLPNGRRTTLRGAGSCAGDPTCFIVTVSWRHPGSEETRRVTTVARINEGAPAAGAGS